MPFVLAILLAPLVALVASAPAPPLSERQRIDLETAADGSDHREQAFYALVESIRAWPPHTDLTGDGEPIHLTFNEATLIARPQDFRAELFRIEGELLQHTPLAPPYEDVSEWFVRDARQKTPVIVYMIMTDKREWDANRQSVRIDARFYKTVRFTARDGKTRDYPAFVARDPDSILPPTVPSSATQAVVTKYALPNRMSIIGGIVAALFITFFIVRMWAARQRRDRPDPIPRLRPSWIENRNPAPAPIEDDAAGLPDDPVEALAELKRRAES